MHGCAMRYFFDLNDEIDQTGTDLPAREAIPRTALGFVLAVAAEAPEAGRAFRLRVCDEARRPIYHAMLTLDGCWARQESEPA